VIQPPILARRLSPHRRWTSTFLALKPPVGKENNAKDNTRPFPSNGVRWLVAGSPRSLRSLGRPGALPDQSRSLLTLAESLLDGQRPLSGRWWTRSVCPALSACPFQFYLLSSLTLTTHVSFVRSTKKEAGRTNPNPMGLSVLFLLSISSNLLFIRYRSNFLSLN